MSVDSSTRGELARGGALSAFGAAMSAVLGFVLTVILARLLGVSGAGVVMQATGVFAMAMALAKVGLDSTAIFLIPRLLVDDSSRVRPALRFMAVTSLIASVVLAAILWVLSPVIWGNADGDVADAVRAIAVFLPAGALVLIGAAALRALGSVRDYVLVSNIVVPGLRPPFVALAAVSTGSVVAVTVSWAIPLVIVLGVIAALLSRSVSLAEGERRRAGYPDRGERGVIVRFAAPRTLTAALEQGLNWIDVVLVGLLAGASAAGIYGGASRFIQAGLLVDAALRVIVGPKFSMLLHSGDQEQVRDLHRTITVWLVLFSTPIYVLLAAFSPVFLSLLGPGFVVGSTTLVILCAGAILTFQAGPIHSLLLMSGRSGYAALNKGVVVTLNVVGNVVLVPRFGIVAAGAVWAVCMIVDALLAAIEVRLFLGISLRPSDPLIPLGVVSGTVAVPSALVLALVGPTVGGLLTALGICALTFPLGVWLGRRPLCVEGLGKALRERFKKER